MTEAEALKELTLRAAEVARRAPPEWSRLIEALRIITTHRRDQCVSSPADTVFILQGRAREAASLLGVFETCVKAADQIAEKRK